MAQYLNLSSFAEQMLIHEHACVAIRKDMPLDRAALIGCSVMTGVGAAIHTSSVRPGETVAVIGLGGVGLAAVNGAAIAGAGRIIAIDMHASKLNLAKHFGRKMADRLEPPCLNAGTPWYSEKIEDFYLNLHEALDKGPCIYVLDSMDALSSEEEVRDYAKMKKADAEGMEAKIAKAFTVGKDLAEKAKKAGITAVVFDRGGYTYHGRVKALADGARAGGLEF